MDNAMFNLSETQLARYAEWAARLTRPSWDADAAESAQAVFTFTFSAFGRRVEARIGDETLLLEET